jgi:hypothetical protein
LYEVCEVEFFLVVFGRDEGEGVLEEGGVYEGDSAITKGDKFFFWRAIFFFSDGEELGVV